MRAKTSQLLTIGLSALAAASGQALAQTGAEGIERRSAPGADRIFETPSFLDDQDDPIKLPPPPPVRGGTPTGDAVRVDKVNVSGATVFTQHDIDTITNEYEERYLTTDDILALRDALTALYVNAGYINSGAVIPPQDTSNGVLRVDIIEGILTEVTATRDKGLRPSYVTRRMRVDPSRPLNSSELRKKFQFLINDPNIERVDARLSPGEEPGEATLDLDVTAAPRYFVNIIFANDRSPSVGGNRIALQGGMRNLIGVGDLVVGEVGATRGLFDAAASYSVPLTASDLMFTVSGDYSDAEVIEEPLNALDVISLSYGASASLTYPIWRQFRAGERGSTTRIATLGAEVGYKRTETELLGQNFSFSPGAVDGITEIIVARASQAFVQQSARQVIAVRSTFSLGLDALDPVIMLPITPPKNFFVWLGQAQYARRLTDSGHQISARLDGQIATDPLFPTEKFAFGGQNTVRGYRVNQTLSDSGVVGSVEYSLPVGSVFGGAGRGALSSLRVSTFVDAGYGWNVNAADPTEDLLVSAGVGAAWAPIEGVSVAASWAARIKKTPNPIDRGPQDWGLGFRIIVSPLDLF